MSICFVLHSESEVGAGGGESEEGEEPRGKYSKFLLTNSRVPISCYSSGPFLSLYQCGFICCLCV